MIGDHQVWKIPKKKNLYLRKDSFENLKLNLIKKSDCHTL